jgi:hypothetical protein
MNPTLEQILIAAFILGALAFFIRRALRRKPGCGCDCGCPLPKKPGAPK